MLTTDVLNFYFKRIPVSSGKRECSEATIFKKIALANVGKFLSLHHLPFRLNRGDTYVNLVPPSPPPQTFIFARF